MSIDYYIYLRNASVFSSVQFEQYCAEHGMAIRLHPAFDLISNYGFVQMNLKDARFSKEKIITSYLTGFELFCDAYHHPVAKRQHIGLWGRLFGKKTSEETSFEKAIRDSNLVLTLNCSGEDSFEILIAYMFGAYLVTCCGGIFDDPQRGQYYDSEHALLMEANIIIAELSNPKHTDELLTHPFTNWDN